MNYNVFPLLDSNSKQRFLIQKSRYYNPNLSTISEMVLKAIDEQIGVKPELVKSNQRYRPICEARHIYCAIMRNKYHLTTVSIGKSIGKDHATVINACKVAKNLHSIDVEFRYKYKQVEGYLS